MPTIEDRVDDVTVSVSGKRRLKARWWRRPQPRGVLVVAHGFGEHGGAYAYAAEALGLALEIDVVAHDFLGHGRSPGRRGVVRRYEDLVDDLQAVVSWARRRFIGLPIYLLGHSNGGQVVLRYAIEHGDAVAGVIVSNPFLRIAMPIPRAKLWLGRMLMRFAPWITLKAHTPSGGMTSDPGIQASFQSDALRHHRISPPLFFGMVLGGEMLISRAAEFRPPLLMLIGGQDPLVDPQSGREFFDRVEAEDKTLILYPKMLHEPLNEIGREKVVADIVRWLAVHLDRPAAGG
ncbi:alpha/beta hydrolase [Paludisphaera borealis]|uniref:Phospholipase YtpA n=1 Tax=Paludisphaera borealis TaxID=1387353 RepID=A0A1U7CM00_9BACT|nr:alpha/beta hydrolase [Paludisphaera borealis]APW59974.1 Phospholipase YtpA [Paludisphaera borealis]